MKNNILNTLNTNEKHLVKAKTFKKNDVLFYEGEECKNISILVSGEIKISSTSFEGEELIYNILCKNDIFGNNLIFSDETSYKGDVICTKDSTVVFIEKDNLLHLLQTNKDFLLNYLNIQSNFGKRLNATIKMLSYDSAEERFKFYLYQNYSQIEYDSVADLAAKLHLQRETLSRLLTKLEKENVIKRSPHKIILIG